MGNYTIKIENLRDSYLGFEPLFRAHYEEMCARRAAIGLETSPYNPRLADYFKINDDGWLLFFAARTDAGDPAGYSLIYVTQDMHNMDCISQEDMIFVAKAHRNGLGRRMAKFVLEELRSRGVKRFSITAATDPRATMLWQRMGFKPSAQQMEYAF